MKFVENHEWQFSEKIYYYSLCKKCGNMIKYVNKFYWDTIIHQGEKNEQKWFGTVVKIQKSNYGICSIMDFSIP